MEASEIYSCVIKANYGEVKGLKPKKTQWSGLVKALTLTMIEMLHNDLKRAIHTRDL